MQSDEHYVELILDHFRKNKCETIKELLKRKPVRVPEVDNAAECPSQPIYVYVSVDRLRHAFMLYAHTFRYIIIEVHTCKIIQAIYKGPHVTLCFINYIYT